MSPPHTPPPPQKPSGRSWYYKKTRFFHAIDHRGKKTIPLMCRDEGVSYGTGKLGLRQRKQLGTPTASRRVGKNQAGSAVKVTKQKLNEMLDDQKNSVRDQSWHVQIHHFQLNCTKRTLQRVCKRRTLKADRYRMLKVKDISSKNRKLRVKYDHRHKDETIESFWQYVHWTNEAHVDSRELYSKRILREEDRRYESQNMQSMLEVKKIKLHFAAFVFWHHKSLLIFYNNKHDTLSIIKKPSKSRKSKYETKKQHHQRVVEWKISLSYDADIKLKEIRWLRFITQISCYQCMQIWFTRHEFILIEETSYKKIMTTIMTHDQQITLCYAASRLIDSKRCLIHLNRLI